MNKSFITFALIPIYGNYGCIFVLYDVNGEPMSTYWENHSKGTYEYRKLK